MPCRLIRDYDESEIKWEEMSPPSIWPAFVAIFLFLLVVAAFFFFL